MSNQWSTPAMHLLRPSVVPRCEYSIPILATGVRRVFQGFGQALIFALREVAEIRPTKMDQDKMS